MATLLAKLSLGVQGVDTFHAHVRAVARPHPARTGTGTPGARKRKRATGDTGSAARSTSPAIPCDGEAAATAPRAQVTGAEREPKTAALQPLLLADFLGDSTRDRAPIVSTDLITQLLDARAAQCALLGAEADKTVQ